MNSYTQFQDDNEGATSIKALREQQNINEPSKKRYRKSHKHINKIVSDINESLNKLDEDDESDLIDLEHLETVQESTKKISWSTIPSWVKEGILLITIYMLLSVKAVYEFIGSQIRAVSASETGVVSIWGIFLYGVILTTIFLLAKFLLKI